MHYVIQPTPGQQNLIAGRRVASRMTITWSTAEANVERTTSPPPVPNSEMPTLKVVVATAVGCTSGGGADARAPAAATATTVHHMTTTQTDLAADASPREVRARFEQLLGQHALLAVRLGRSEVAEDTVTPVPVAALSVHDRGKGRLRG